MEAFIWRAFPNGKENVGAQQMHLRLATLIASQARAGRRRSWCG